MRSFGILALAAAAIAPFVGAAPAPAPVAVAVHARSVDVGAAAGVVAGVHVRDMDPAAGVYARGTKGVAGILVDLKVNLGVHIDALNCLTKSNATTEVITPILKGVVSVVGVAVVDLKALVGADISVILCAVDGTALVTVTIIANLLAEILCLIFGALGFVLSIVADVKILLEILVSIAFGDCICGLISAILVLVDGLLIELVPLVLGLVSVILSLGLDVVGKLLTIC